MELFSEIYSCYYKAVEKILNTALNKPLTKKDIAQIINDNAFSESAYYILPKLLSGEWNLVKEDEDGYVSKITSTIKRPITMLEKAWMKSLITDKRIALFLEEEHILYLNEHLKDIEPLYDSRAFYCYDAFSDGDDYENKNYIQNFRKVLKALKNKELITISFESSKRGRITGNYLPCKIEYSSKDDKFRVHVVRIRYNKIVTTAIINMARIACVEACGEHFSGEIDYDKLSEQNKCCEPVVIEISKERNAVERCMLHFASYEKRTEYDEAADKYISYIYYDKQDETELLIRILSFGPVIKVLGPESFLNLIKERIKRQKELLGI